MARNIEDIASVQFDLKGTVSIDLERIETDPIWQEITINYPHFSPQELFNSYFSYYIRSDKFLSEAPFTNGPGGLILEHLEINNGY